MAEWLKARASKACIPLRVSGVRIPLSPPVFKPDLIPKPREPSHTAGSRRLDRQSREVPFHPLTVFFAPSAEDAYLRR
jgi:hypothetical protein